MQLEQENLEELQSIGNMIKSTDFETTKLGFTLALETFPEWLLKWVTGWTASVLFGGNHRKYLTVKTILQIAIRFNHDCLEFNRCAIMIGEVLRRLIIYK